MARIAVQEIGLYKENPARRERCFDGVQHRRFSVIAGTNKATKGSPWLPIWRADASKLAYFKLADLHEIPLSLELAPGAANNKRDGPTQEQRPSGVN
jgi:hypothetical protein